MKTLFNKIIATGILGAGLVLGGCGDKKELKKINSDSSEVIINGKPYYLKSNGSLLVLDQDYEIRVNRKKIDELTELEKFNLENKQISDDFYEFCMENPYKIKLNKRLYEIPLYHYDYANGDKLIFDEKTKEINLSVREKTFYDFAGDGLDLTDLYGIAEGHITNMSSIRYLAYEKDQLFFAKEFRDLEIRIMNDAKFKK